MQNLLTTQQSTNYRAWIDEGVANIEKAMRKSEDTETILYIMVQSLNICMGIRRFIEAEQKSENQERGIMAIDSRDVAEIVGKNHAHLMRDIQSYSEILGKSKIGLAEFFIESAYNDRQGKLRAHYLLTRKGCEFVGNKMTGEKGILFTAAYINKFHEMEAKPQKPKNSEVVHIETKQPTEAKTNNALEIKAINAKTRLSNQYLKLSKLPALTDEQRAEYAFKAAQALDKVTE